MVAETDRDLVAFAHLEWRGERENDVLRVPIDGVACRHIDGQDISGDQPQSIELSVMAGNPCLIMIIFLTWNSQITQSNSTAAAFLFHRVPAIARA